MRCYLMRKGHIKAIVFLSKGTDIALIEQGEAIFRQQTESAFDGFEVWDGTRRVHVHPEDADTPDSL
jgi:hypothetical protein